MQIAAAAPRSRLSVSASVSTVRSSSVLPIGFVRYETDGPLKILDQRLDAGMARDEHDALDGARAQLFEQLEAVAVGQHQVEQQHVGRRAAEQPARTLEALRALDRVAVQLQHFLRRRDKIRFVVYQQDVRHEYPAKDQFFVVGRLAGRAHGHELERILTLIDLRNHNL